MKTETAKVNKKTRMKRKVKSHPETPTLFKEQIRRAVVAVDRVPKPKKVIKLHHGEAFEVLGDLSEKGKKRGEEGLFDLVLTDPPYKPSKGATAHEFTPKVESGIIASSNLVKEGGRMAVMAPSGGKGLRRMLECCRIITLARPDLPLMRILPWCKDHTRGRGLGGPFGWQTVQILILGKCSGAICEMDHIFAPALQYKRDGSAAHKAQLPGDVCNWLAHALVQPGVSVLDPFAGTASLLVAAAQFGATKCVGIDIDSEAIKTAREIHGEWIKK